MAWAAGLVTLPSHWLCAFLWGHSERCAPSSPACFWAHTCAVKGRARQASVSGTGCASLTPGLEVKPWVKAWPLQGARESPEQRACPFPDHLRSTADRRAPWWTELCFKAECRWCGCCKALLFPSAQKGLSSQEPRCAA